MNNEISCHRSLYLNHNKMWHKTRVTEILGIKYPILQGPFGGNLSSSALVAVVSNKGGLGGYGAYSILPEQIASVNKEIKEKTDKPYAINLWVSDVDEATKNYSAGSFQKLTRLFKPYFDELGIPLPQLPGNPISKFEQQAETILSIRPPVFSFMFGIPSAEILKECKRQGIVTIGSATTLDEALALEEAGTDLILASGFEAGGHRPSFIQPAKDSLTGTFTLVQQIVHHVKTPVIAAGGIADGRGVAAALTLGAGAVQVGTAFLVCDESNASSLHKEMLFSKESRHSVLTSSFTGRLGRGMRSRLATDLQGLEDEIAPFPLQTLFLSPLRVAAIAQHKLDMVMFWGGQIAPVLKHTSAAELMDSLISETENIFKQRK